MFYSQLSTHKIDQNLNILCFLTPSPYNINGFLHNCCWAQIKRFQRQWQCLVPVNLPGIRYPLFLGHLILVYSGNCLPWENQVCATRNAESDLLHPVNWVKPHNCYYRFKVFQVKIILVAILSKMSAASHLKCETLNWTFEMQHNLN